MKEWLESLKPGDPVIVSYGDRSSVDEVARLTKTQIVLKGTRVRYRRQGGHSIGESAFHSSWLVKATPEAIQKVEEAQERRLIIHRLRNTPWHKLDTRMLKKVQELVSQAAKEEA